MEKNPCGLLKHKRIFSPVLMNITDHNTLTQLGHLQNIKESSKVKCFHKNPCLHFKDIPVGSTFFIIKNHIFVKAEHYV